MTEYIPNKTTQSTKIDHFGMFAFLWAIALLWHYLRRPVDYSEFYVLFIPAVLVLTRPKSAIFMLAMAIGYIHIFLHEMPFSTRPNHPTLILLMNLTIISSALWVMLNTFIKSRTLELDREQWFDIFRPLLITAINIVYLMAVFNKLNTAFFDIHTSPVTRLLNFYYTSDTLLFIPSLLPHADWVLQFGIIATLVIETTIPLMLWIRRTRLLGIFVGVIFHMILSVRLYPSMAEFPTLLLAAYILALPDSTIPMLRDLWGKFREKTWFLPARSFGILFAAWFFFLLPMVFQWPAEQSKLILQQSEIWSYSWVIYLAIYYIIIIYLLIRTRGGFNEPKDIQWFQPRNVIIYFFPLLIFLNGLTPYMGLKNKGSWNMYSHLRTENGYSNHLFMPNFYLFPYMNEVCVVDSSDPELRKIARNKKLLTESHFTEWARNNPEASVEFFYNGEHFVADQIKDFPQFMRPKEWLEEIFWISNSGDGFENLDWCQRYIVGNNTGDQIAITLSDYTYVLWDENSRWTPDDDE